MINRLTTHLSKHFLTNLGNRSAPRTELFSQKHICDNRVQKPYLCYSKVLELIDQKQFNNIKKSPYYDYHEIASQPEENFIPCFIKEKAFTASELSEMMGHRIFTRFEVTFNQLDLYFKASESHTLYCLLRWGDDKDKIGYERHCILIDNVFKKEGVEYISYLDVSDKLPIKYPRVRIMSLAEFNKRREVFSLGMLLNINFLNQAKAYEHIWAATKR